MAPERCNKSLKDKTEAERQCLLEGDHQPLPQVGLYTDTPERNGDVNKNLLKDQTTPFPKTHNEEDQQDTCSLLPEGKEEQEEVGRKQLMIRDGSSGDDGEERGEKQEKEGGRETEKKMGPGPPRRVRDLVAFWLLGFCNNFTYWVMITAAYDLLSVQAQTYMERSQQPPPGSPYISNHSSEVFVQMTSDVASTWTNDSATLLDNTFKCRRHSTGAILVADTLPATALTLAAPLTLLVGVWPRVMVLSGLCVASYLILGLATPNLVFLGVALASASRGFSDTTFLAHASHYHKHVLSLWSSGTGVATFMGPLLYSLLTTGGVDPQHTLLIFITIPIIIVVSFSCILSHKMKPCSSSEDIEGQQVVRFPSDQDLESKNQKKVAVIKEKFFLFLKAQTYLLPLAVFYLVMYFTNQGLLELVYFPASQLTHAQQYSWSNTVRCLGTLISRSMHKLFLLPSVWLYNIPLILILVVVGTEAHYHYLPSEYIILALLLLQGLLEGAAFRATVFNIHKKANEEREFCLGIFPSSLFLPAMLAGFISIPVHDFLCHHHLYNQGQ